MESCGEGIARSRLEEDFDCRQTATFGSERAAHDFSVVFGVELACLRICCLPSMIDVAPISWSACAMVVVCSMSTP